MEIRDNGFLAFLPRFGLKAPVYLKDQEGVVMVPKGLSDKSLSDTTSVALGGSLVRSDSCIEVTTTAGAGFTFRVFDHVLVQVEVVPNHYRRPGFRLLLLDYLKAMQPTPSKRDIIEHVQHAAGKESTVITNDSRAPKPSQDSAYDILLRFQELSLLEDML